MPVVGKYSTIDQFARFAHFSSNLGISHRHEMQLPLCSPQPQHSSSRLSTIVLHRYIPLLRVRVHRSHLNQTTPHRTAPHHTSPFSQP